jgi:hypothetical protein
MGLTIDDNLIYLLSQRYAMFAIYMCKDEQSLLIVALWLTLPTCVNSPLFTYDTYQLTWVIYLGSSAQGKKKLIKSICHFIFVGSNAFEISQ